MRHRKRQASQSVIGIGTVLGSALLAAVTFLTIRTIPELVRYFKVRRM